MNDDWITISDDEVVAIWQDGSGMEHRIPPWFYADAGTPIDEGTGDDMEYVRTEIIDQGQPVNGPDEEEAAIRTLKQILHDMPKPTKGPDARHQALDRLDQLHKIFPPPILPQDEGRYCVKPDEMVTVNIYMTLTATVKRSELEMSLNDPHIAFDIPKEIIIDDITGVNGEDING